MIAVEFSLDEAEALGRVLGGAYTPEQECTLRQGIYRIQQAVKVETGPGGSESPLPAWMPVPHGEPA